MIHRDQSPFFVYLTKLNEQHEKDVRGNRIAITKSGYNEKQIQTNGFKVQTVAKTMINWYYEKH
ncbi:hypothetical protein AN965_05785 [Alkalicoccobacillus plakortidis]|uniref:Uncharacterized protein n=1 Tax=Alkalicoccobacillus plakortidis TaxID=444060 RepID=A0A9D5I1M0_9BACI|nr:hypothetical protein [Alkalicoccobacillus plakortidis]KQL57832.1 hypothetical protein AN965_05785 [Alkalicoccobacillus plakortidis]